MSPINRLSGDIIGSLGLPRLLTERLQQPLPGWRVQRWFQPELSFGRYFEPTPTNARLAAVLVLLYPHEGRWCLPLTLRPEHMVEHAGQISLPGGVIEPGERSSDAALRELHEELGVGREGIELLGPLSGVYVFRSNFQVTPWVAVLDRRPEWQPNAGEVAELLEVPLAHLTDPAHRTVITRQRGPYGASAPAFMWEGHAIWGATSLVLGELVALLDELNAVL